jgi:hypothetical protein
MRTGLVGGALIDRPLNRLGESNAIVPGDLWQRQRA